MVIHISFSFESFAALLRTLLRRLLRTMLRTLSRGWPSLRNTGFYTPDSRIESASPYKTATTTLSCNSFVRMNKAGLVSVEWMPSSALQGLRLKISFFFFFLPFRL